MEAKANYNKPTFETLKDVNIEGWTLASTMEFLWSNPRHKQMIYGTPDFNKEGWTPFEITAGDGDDFVQVMEVELTTVSEYVKYLTQTIHILLKLKE